MLSLIPWSSNNDCMNLQRRNRERKRHWRIIKRVTKRADFSQMLKWTQTPSARMWCRHSQRNQAVRMLRIGERHLEFISKSPHCWQFKPKGQRSIVPLLVPPTFSPNISSVNHSCFSGCCFFLASLFPLFSFSLITLYLHFPIHRLRLPPPWLSFIRSKPHFRHSAYSWRPFSLQMPSFCRIKALVQNQFPLLSIMFFFSPSSIHSGLFFPLTHCLLLFVIRKIDSGPLRRLEQGHGFYE